MDPQRFREAFDRLQLLEERYAGRLPRRERASLHRMGAEQMEDQLRTLASYAHELREIVEELFAALVAANRPGPPPSQTT